MPPALRNRTATGNTAAPAQTGYGNALAGYEQTLATDIAKDDFTGAWQFAEAHPEQNAALQQSQANAGGVYAGQFNPLTGLLETSKGLQALDPNKKWTQAEMAAFYQAAGQNWKQQGVLGQNPEAALWGNAPTGAQGASDAATNFATAGDNSAPDVARFAGTRQTQSFLDKYGVPIAAVGLGLATGGLGLAGLVGGELGIGAVGGGALLGAGESAAIDAITGKPITAGSVLPGAVAGGFGASGIASGINSGVGNVVSDVAGDTIGNVAGDFTQGALTGGLKAGLSGGNIATGALAGGAGGAAGGLIGDVTGSNLAGKVGSGLVGSEVKGALAPSASGPSAGSASGYGSVTSGMPTEKASTGALSPTAGSKTMATPAQTTDMSQLGNPGNVDHQDGLIINTPPAASGGTDPTGLGTSLLTSLGSSLGSLATPTNLAYGAAAGLGLAEANSQKSQNQTYADTLANLGKPYVAAGQQQLTTAQSGTLTPAQQAQQANLKSQGGTLTSEANPLISGGTAAITAANAGQLPAWQQAQIDQQTAQQKAQIRQSLGANVDSSTLAQYDAQIDQQAAITKGNLEQQNLASGQSELGQGTNLQQQGQADIQAGYKVATDAAQQAFTNAMNLAATGNGPIMDAVNTLIQGDSQVSSALMSYMGALAKAYASGQSGTKTPATTPSVPTGATPSMGSGSSANLSTGGGSTGNPYTAAINAGNPSDPSQLPTGVGDTSSVGTVPSNLLDPNNLPGTNWSGLPDTSSVGTAWQYPAQDMTPSYDSSGTG